MVAAAGEVGSLRPAVGVCCLIAILIGLIPIVWMSRQTTLTGFVTMDKDQNCSPSGRARLRATSATRIGRPTRRSATRAPSSICSTSRSTIGLRHDGNAQEFWAGRRRSSFWYRRSPHALVPATSRIETIGEVTREQPPPTAPGMVSGTHRSLGPTDRPDGRAATNRRASDRCATAAVDDPVRRGWPAGRGVLGGRSTRIPFVYADALAAWDGVYPDRPDIPIRVEAAAARGRPVYFGIVAPWTRPQELEPTGPLNAAGHTAMSSLQASPR